MPTRKVTNLLRLSTTRLQRLHWCQALRDLTHRQTSLPVHAVALVLDSRSGAEAPCKHFSNLLPSSYDRTADFAPVARDSFTHRFHFFEFTVFLAGCLETLRAIIVCEIFAINRQMAASAPQFLFSTR
jgi:hypothetical protein